MSSESPTEKSDLSSREISLEDLDQLLESEDPGFTASLESVRAIVPDSTVTIDPTDIEGLEGAESGEGAASSSRFKRLKLFSALRLNRITERLGLAVYRGRRFIKSFGRQAVVFLKARPKELFFYLLSTARTSFQYAKYGRARLAKASWSERAAWLVLTLAIGFSVWMLAQNLRGSWLPHLGPPVLARFTPYADFVETYSRKEPGESFYAAFPQERHEFLFGKMKVNLRRTAEHPIPMGAFELVAQVDSKDTAIELNDREIEFSDLLQRVFEEESFTDLESEAGKGRVKGRLKRELNQRLTQGWVKDINFKTFILKP